MNDLRPMPKDPEWRFTPDWDDWDAATTFLTDVVAGRVPVDAATRTQATIFLLGRAKVPELDTLLRREED